MDLSKSTILITGGSSGIGLEFAKQLMQLGAKVIITGRNLVNLKEVKKQYPAISIFKSDLNNTKDIEYLHHQVTTEFPELNIIINNAGIMRSEELFDTKVTLENVTDEINTNFISSVRMIHQFLPHLASKQSSAIVNITSGLAYLPFTISPLYCGTKAGIHIYSQALRLQLKNTNVKVFEIAPPKTDKPLQTAIAENHGTSSAMKVQDMVKIAIKGIIKNHYEINPGMSKIMKLMSRIAPEFFTKMINRNIEKAKLKQYTN